MCQVNNLFFVSTETLQGVCYWLIFFRCRKQCLWFSSLTLGALQYWIRAAKPFRVGNELAWWDCALWDLRGEINPPQRALKQNQPPNVWSECGSIKDYTIVSSKSTSSVITTSLFNMKGYFLVCRVFFCLFGMGLLFGFVCSWSFLFVLCFVGFFVCFLVF